MRSFVHKMQIMKYCFIMYQILILWHRRFTSRKLLTSVSPQEHLHTISCVMYQVKIITLKNLKKVLVCILCSHSHMACEYNFLTFLEWHYRQLWFKAYDFLDFRTFSYPGNINEHIIPEVMTCAVDIDWTSCCIWTQ